MKPAKKTGDGLRKPQVRVLQALAKSKDLTRAEIATKAKTDVAWLTEYIGSSDSATRKRNDKKVLSLLTRGYVKAAEQDGATTYTITAAGRKALEAAKA